MSVSASKVVVGDVADKFKLPCQRVHTVTVAVCRRPDLNQCWLTPATDLNQSATTFRQLNGISLKNLEMHAILRKRSQYHINPTTLEQYATLDNLQSRFDEFCFFIVHDQMRKRTKLLMSSLFQVTYIVTSTFVEHIPPKFDTFNTQCTYRLSTCV